MFEFLKNSKLESELLEVTKNMCSLLQEMKSKGKFTEAVYKTELEKRIKGMKMLNESYSQVLATREN